MAGSRPKYGKELSYDGVRLSCQLSGLRKNVRLIWWGFKRLSVVASADIVELIMNAPIWFGPSLRSLRISLSRTGIMKVGVFPELVTASTTASLCYMNNGIAAAWMDVIRVRPVASAALGSQERSELTPS